MTLVTDAADLFGLSVVMGIPREYDFFGASLLRAGNQVARFGQVFIVAFPGRWTDFHATLRGTYTETSKLSIYGATTITQRRIALPMMLRDFCAFLAHAKVLTRAGARG